MNFDTALKFCAKVSTWILTNHIISLDVTTYQQTSHLLLRLMSRFLPQSMENIIEKLILFLVNLDTK